MTAPRDPASWRPVDLGEGAGRGDPHYLAELFRDPLDPGYADAAARRRARDTGAGAAGTTGGSADGSTGGSAGPLRRYGGRGAAVVTLLVVGVLLAVAYRQVVAEEPTRAQVRDDLQEQVRERGALTDELQATAERLRDEVGQLRDRELTDPRARQLRELEAATGLARVRGDGVVIRLDDGPGQVDPATGAQVVAPEARILDWDLQLVANTLWAAGAEAIAINDRRLTSSSTIRGASGAILVDRVPVVGPYQVVAIGPDELADLFAGSTTARDLRGLMQDFGITYELREERDLKLPAATAPQLHYAVPQEAD